MENNVIPMYSKISIYDLFMRMNETQYAVNKDLRMCVYALKTKYEILTATVITLFLSLAVITIGVIWGFHEFKTDIQPEIEQKYPVPVEMLKGV